MLFALPLKCQPHSPARKRATHRTTFCTVPKHGCPKATGITAEAQQDSCFIDTTTHGVPPLAVPLKPPISRRLRAAAGCLAATGSTSYWRQALISSGRCDLQLASRKQEVHPASPPPPDLRAVTISRHAALDAPCPRGGREQRSDTSASTTRARCRSHAQATRARRSQRRHFTTSTGTLQWCLRRPHIELLSLMSSAVKNLSLHRHTGRCKRLAQAHHIPPPPRIILQVMH